MIIFFKIELSTSFLKTNKYRLFINTKKQDKFIKCILNKKNLSNLSAS